MIKKISNFLKFWQPHIENNLDLNNLHHFFEKMMRDENYEALLSILHNGYSPHETYNLNAPTDSVRKLLIENFNNAAKEITKYNQFHSLVRIPLKAVFYFKIVNHFGLLDDFIFEEIHKKGPIGELYDMIFASQTNKNIIQHNFTMSHFQMYAKSAFRTQEEIKRHKTFNDIDMVVQANYLEFLAFEKNEVKAQAYKQLLYRLGDINYLNEAKVCKKYTETYSRPSVRKNTEELFHEMLPSDENKRNRLFLAPFFSPEVEIRVENLHKPDAQIGLLNIDRIHNLVIESAGENSDTKKPTISVHSEYFQRQFFAAAVPVLKRYVASLTQEEVMQKIPLFLKNKHLSTFGTFVNYLTSTPP